MTSIKILPVRFSLFRTMILGAAIASCAALAADAALAQEGAPAGGDAPQAGDGVVTKGPAPDAEPFTPQRGSAGLQRRANLKALIANARGNAPGLPPATLHIVPSPLRPAMQAAPPRNAIGIAMPAAPSPGHGIMTPAGIGAAGIGAPAANVANMTHQTSLPKAVLARGTGINGTAMGRAASSPGSIGGPAKDRSGINGTLMPPKR